jgi:hypothetical protein
VHIYCPDWCNPSYIVTKLFLAGRSRSQQESSHQCVYLAQVFLRRLVQTECSPCGYGETISSLAGLGPENGSIRSAATQCRAPMCVAVQGLSGNPDISGVEVSVCLDGGPLAEMRCSIDDRCLHIRNSLRNAMFHGMLM